MSKPRIIVLCKDSANTFQWMSDGWHIAKQAGTKEAKDLMTKAEAAIDAAKDVPDAIARLQQAGFEITRD